MNESAAAVATTLGSSIGFRPTSSSSEPYVVKRLQLLREVTAPIVLVIGQTGGGKSAVTNALLGRDVRVAEESSSMQSCTAEISIYEGKWFGNAAYDAITVIDTPGFFDSERRDSNFLAKLTAFLSNFPLGKLQTVAITLPITETRSASTYQKMIDQIELLFGANVWHNTVFVTTHHNQFNPAPEYTDVLKMKQREWLSWLEDVCLIPNPIVCEFNYGIPESLRAIHSKSLKCSPFTPTTSEKIHALLQSNPAASPQDIIANVEGLRKMKSDWEIQMQSEIRKTQATLQILQETQNQSRRQAQQLEKTRQEAAALEQKLAAGPPVHVIYC